MCTVPHLPICPCKTVECLTKYSLCRCKSWQYCLFQGWWDSHLLWDAVRNAHFTILWKMFLLRPHIYSINIWIEGCWLKTMKQDWDCWNLPKLQTWKSAEVFPLCMLINDADIMDKNACCMAEFQAYTTCFSFVHIHSVQLQIQTSFKLSNPKISNSMTQHGWGALSASLSCFQKFKSFSDQNKSCFCLARTGKPSGS